MSFIASFKSTREAIGISQVQLSARSGVSLPTIQNIEAKKANPTISVVEALCRALGLEKSIASASPDWDLLMSYGLPLGHAKKGLEEPSPQLFCHHVILASVDPSLSHDERKRDSLRALILALELHFPSVFKRHLKKVVSIQALKPTHLEGRLIKLKRIAHARLALWL